MNLHRLLCMAAILSPTAAFLASSAAADQGSGNSDGQDSVSVTINGTVDEICQVDLVDPTSGADAIAGVESGTLSQSGSGDDTTVGFDFEIPNRTDVMDKSSSGNKIGAIAAGGVTIPVAIYCNSEFTLEWTGDDKLANSATPNSGSFNNEFGIAVSASVGGDDIPLDNGTETSVQDELDDTAGNSSIEISWDAQDNLIAGVYSGTVTLTVKAD